MEPESESESESQPTTVYFDYPQAQCPLRIYILSYCVLQYLVERHQTNTIAYAKHPCLFLS